MTLRPPTSVAAVSIPHRRESAGGRQTRV